MSVNLPIQFEARTVSNKTRIALSGQNKRRIREIVDPVMKTLARPSDPIGSDRDAMLHLDLKKWMKVIEIDGARSGVRENPKVAAGREERIKASKTMTGPVLIPT